MRLSVVKSTPQKRYCQMFFSVYNIVMSLTSVKQVRFSPWQLEAIKKPSKKNKIPISSMIRLAVSLFLLDQANKKFNKEKIEQIHFEARKKIN